MAKKTLEERVARVEAFVKKPEDSAAIRELNKRAKEFSRLTSDDLMQQFTI